MKEMKDSGVPWIGEIPTGWITRRIKTLFTERVELSETGTETLLSVSEYYGVDSRSAHIDEDEYLSRSESLVGYKKCYPGDIVSNIMLAWKGSLGIASQEGIVSPAYCVYKPSSEAYPKYYHYLFRTSLYTGQFKCHSKGIIDSRLRLYSPFFFDITALIPPTREQISISDFLDAKCAEIDSILEQTRASIEGYKMLKQSVITEAVTKGIRGKRPMKDSGVEWIGEIPADWRLVRLRFLSQIYTGNQDTQDNNPDGEFPFYVRSPFVERSNRWTFEGPAILMAGDGAGAGRVFHYVDGKYGCHQRVYSIQSIHGVSRRVLYYYLKELFYIMIETANSKSTVDSVRLDMLKDFPICVAPEEEQQEIAAYLDEKCAAIDSLITSKEALVSELEAYKKSIIYEYVTGKKEIPDA